MADPVKPEWLKSYETFKAQPWEPTTLPPDEEGKFQDWLKGTKWFSEISENIAKEKQVPPDKIDKGRVLEMILKDADYDYRGAYKAGVGTTPDMHDNGRLHWPDQADGKMLKSPQHPSAWMEFFMQEHRKNPEDLGLHNLKDAARWSLDGAIKDTRQKRNEAAIRLDHGAAKEIDGQLMGIYRGIESLEK